MRRRLPIATRPSFGLAGSLTLTVALAAALFGCPRRTPPPPPPPGEPIAAFAAARTITDAADLLPGPAAYGAVGDILVENDLARFVIQARDEAIGFAQAGGIVLDAAPRTDDGLVLLNQTFPQLNDTWPRQARYATVEIVEAGGEGADAVVVARGLDSDDPAVSVKTEYRLSPGLPYLLMTTTVLNEGETVYEDYELADGMQWGMSQHWGPGYGFELRGKRIEVPWMAGLGETTSYGWVAPGRTLRSRSGSTWSDPIADVVRLEPGEPVSYVRALVVGTGDAASVLDAIYDLHGGESGVLTGIFEEDGSGEAIGGALVEIRDAEGRPFATARTAEDGTFRVRLPPGAWSVFSRTLGRGTAAPGAATLTAGGRADATVVASRQAILDVMVVEVRRDPETPDVLHQFPVPSRLTFEGLGETPAPNLGPSFDHGGADNVLFLATGQGEVRLPPGTYRVHASRGVEYEIDTQEIEVVPGERARLEMRLRRSVDTTGWVSGDFHQHANNSFDSAVTLESRVISNAAEGVEILVSSDHNHVTDYAPVIANLDLGEWLVSFTGVEATTARVGHINCYPFSVKPGLPAGGAPNIVERTPSQIFEDCRAEPGEVVVQINHPRSGHHGYFDLVGLDPETAVPVEARRRHALAVFDDSFDAIEIVNGKRVPESEKVMQDWFNLLNRDMRYTATGNSDTHTLLEDNNGYPRNFVHLGVDRPEDVTIEALVDAVKNRRAVVVTNGPFPELSARVAGEPVADAAGAGEAAQIAGVGETLRVPAGAEVTFTTRVQAAGWVSVDALSLVRGGEAVVAVPLDPENRETVRHEAEYTLTFEESGWVVLRVSGSEPLTPVVIQPLDHEVAAIAFTNPIWVEVVAED
jgi:hypothetical protein